MDFVPEESAVNTETIEVSIYCVTSSQAGSQCSIAFTKRHMR